MTSASPAALLHRFLGIGLLGLVAVQIALTYAGVVPLLDREGSSSTIAYVLAGIGLAQIAASILALKPRVPERRSGQTVEQYWSTPEVVQAANLTWFLVEGAGVLNVVGFFLSGQLISLIVQATALVAFWLCRPAALANE
jgi:hypothetical protein